MMHESGGMVMSHGLFMGIGWIFQLLILILFFVVVWWMIKQTGVGGGWNANDSALDILKKRLVRGEIDTKEYEKLKREIEK